jgi:hypothetical protein
MPRTCTVCTHEDRAGIDSALLSGETFRTIAKRYGTSTTALHRHKQDHLPPSLLKAQEIEEVASADNLLDETRALQRKTYGILDKAEEAEDLKTALAAIREARGNMELGAKLAQLIDDRPQVNVVFDQRVQQVILEALEPYDAVKYAVARALKEVRGGPASIS